MYNINSIIYLCIIYSHTCILFINIILYTFYFILIAISPTLYFISSLYFEVLILTL